VVSCLSRDYASLFRHEGARTDKHVRDHEVYSVGGTPSMRRLSDTMVQANGDSGFRYWLRGVGPFGLRRSALLAAPLVILFLVAGGVAARAVFESSESAPSQAARGPVPAAKPAPVQKAAVVPQKPAPAAEKPAPAAEKPAPAAETPAPAPKKQVVARVDRRSRKAAAPNVRQARTPWSPLGARS
jgi:hypothetical protein